MRAPLEGVVVVEVDNWMAGPSAGALLADLGARVLKIEPISGDPMRHRGRPLKGSDVANEAAMDHDYQFDVDNRGKESIRVDLTTAEGIAITHKICTMSDVFMCNLLRARQEKYQLDPKSLLVVNPRLVHATITGYGTQGPDQNRPGYDVVAFFARSGILDASREGDYGAPPQVRTAQGDHTTGLALAFGILAALRMAEKTGEGQVFETSLYQTAVWTLATEYAATVIDKAQLPRRTRREQLSPLANSYPCSDGKWLILTMPEAKSWPNFCRAIDRHEWIDDHRFSSPHQRYANNTELIDAIETVLTTKPRHEWGERFDHCGVIWAPVLAQHEVVEDPQAAAMNMFPHISDPELGSYPTVASPLTFKTANVAAQHRSPRLGEHTHKILKDAGFGNAEIESLIAHQICAGE